MAIIEMLYPEVCNLYGDNYNAYYLAQCEPDIELIKTGLNDQPAFVTKPVSMIYMGPMPDPAMPTVIRRLLPYRDRLKELIDGGTVYLMVSNAMEIFGQYIEYEEEKRRLEGLGLISTFAVRHMMNRYNSLYRGQFTPDDAPAFDVIGFKAQFSKSYGNEAGYLFHTIREATPEDTARNEGYRIGNFFGTYLLGPVLIRNPYFAEYILKKMGYAQPHLAYDHIVKDIFRQRLTEFRKPEIQY